MNILQLSKRDIVDQTMYALIDLFGKKGIDGSEKSFDEKEGTVTIDGKMTVTYSDNSLRMFGFCYQCNQNVVSKPIRKMADVADLLKAFRPAKHTCADL